MDVTQVLDLAEPVVDQAERVLVDGRRDAAAAVVAADDHVLDPEELDRELKHGQAVEVGVQDEVRHVPVDEDLAGQQARDLVGRHPAVGAADPEVLRALLGGEALEEAWDRPPSCGRPRRGCFSKSRSREDMGGTCTG